MTIDILCKVVDNYGDIGVAYRLARALSELEPAPGLRFVVDDLSAFHGVEPLVDPDAAVQSVRGWTVLAWGGFSPATRDAYLSAYALEPARIVIECFACGRPDWLEAMLFDPGDEATKHIVNLEYLTAEPYAEEFHRLPSLTRSSSVRKHMFLPGFSAGTGGLLLDDAFRRSLERSNGPGLRAERARLEALTRLGDDSLEVEASWIVVFGYERDYGRIVDALARLSLRRPVAALVASGKSERCFLEAWERAGRPFAARRLPFLSQVDWDALLAASDFLVVRGEDSLSRAALSGRPFLWHAYPQEGKNQLVKVRALLQRMRRHFSAADYQALEAAFLAFNDRLRDDPATRGDEDVFPLLLGGEGLDGGFQAFSRSLAANGNLAANLMTFLGDLV